MTAAECADATYRHPWLETFEREPVAAFADFIAGYALVHPYNRADRPDAARMLFGHLPADDPARQALDKAVLACLEERRRSPLPESSAKLQRFVAEVAETSEIVVALRLVTAATELRRRFVVWNEWTARLVLAPARDARAAYWRMLASTQPLVADAASADAATIVDLEPFWHRLCREAGNALPRHYLDIGLLGLRRLPHPAGNADAPWLAGLGHWALANDPSDAEFKAEWLPLKSLYPRAPQHWRKLVGELLQTSAFREIDPPGWWRCDPDLEPLGRPGRIEAIRHFYAPTRENCQRVLDRLQPDLGRSQGEIDALLDGHRRYLEATGNPQYFVRAVHSLGAAMLRVTGPDHARYCRFAEDLAREGLGWEPDNRYLWSLWRDSLETRGAVDAAELVGWEFIRRDPANPDARTQLARLLARLPGRQGDAKRLLQETIERFPDNAVARTQLAELLIATDRLDDAHAVVDSAIATGAANAVTWAISARLWSNAGDPARAMQAVEQGLVSDTANQFLRRFAAQLRAGQTLPLVSVGLHGATPIAVAPGDSVLPEGVARRGRLRQLRFAAEQGEQQAAADEIRRVLAEEPGFAYAALLAARQRAWDEADDHLPGFAVAFEAALAAGDQARLEKLSERFPRLQALTWVARAVLGDTEAAELVQLWLGRVDTEDKAVRGLREGLRPLLRLIKGDADASAVFSEHRAAIKHRLHDANEATLDDYLAAA
jgi:tetratricopeptide (TPR) repeat protein